MGRPYSRILFSGGGVTQNDIILDSSDGLSLQYGAENPKNYFIDSTIDISQSVNINKQKSYKNLQQIKPMHGE